MKEKSPINEAIVKNLRKKTVFPAATPDNIKERELSERADHSTYKKNLEKGMTEKTLSSSEKETLTKYLVIAKERLLSLGIQDIDNLLPTLDQVAVFVDSHEDKISAGHISIRQGLMVLQMGKRQNISDLETQRTFYHELAHFISKLIVKRLDNNEFKLAQLGFEKTIESTNTLDGFGTPRITKEGIYEEPLSDLFALYCLNNKDEYYETVYAERDIVVIALLEEFAKRKGISSFEAFAKMFKASKEMDFGFQKELVDIFGTEVVRELNNTIHFNSAGYDDLESKYLEIAEKGGFLEEYKKLYEKYINKEKIEFSGIPGYLVDSHWIE